MPIAALLFDFYTFTVVIVIVMIVSYKIGYRVGHSAGRHEPKDNKN